MDCKAWRRNYDGCEMCKKAPSSANASGCTAENMAVQYGGLCGKGPTPSVHLIWRGSTQELQFWEATLIICTALNILHITLSDSFHMNISICSPLNKKSAHKHTSNHGMPKLSWKQWYSVKIHWTKVQLRSFKAGWYKEQRSQTDIFYGTKSPKLKGQSGAFQSITIEHL